jgi:hypothetical protein
MYTKTFLVALIFQYDTGGHDRLRFADIPWRSDLTGTCLRIFLALMRRTSDGGRFCFFQADNFSRLMKTRACKTGIGFTSETEDAQGEIQLNSTPGWGQSSSNYPSRCSSNILEDTWR